MEYTFRIQNNMFAYEHDSKIVIEADSFEEAESKAAEIDIYAKVTHLRGTNDMQFKDKIILVDCDGVLMDWRYKFTRWMNEQGYQLKNDEINYDVSIQFELTEDEIYPLIELFNQSAAMKYVPPHKDAIRLVKELHEAHGYVFHMITAQNHLMEGGYTTPGIEQARQWRIENTKRLFGKTAFEEFHFTDFGDKAQYLDRYKDTGCWWIEDKWENAQQGLEFGLSPILMMHDYNEQHNDHDNVQSGDIIQVYDWADIYDTIVLGMPPNKYSEIPFGAMNI